MAKICVALSGIRILQTSALPFQSVHQISDSLNGKVQQFGAHMDGGPQPCDVRKIGMEYIARSESLTKNGFGCLVLSDWL
jgi:hypothetical protein